MQSFVFYKLVFNIVILVHSFIKDLVLEKTDWFRTISRNLFESLIEIAQWFGKNAMQSNMKQMLTKEK